MEQIFGVRSLPAQNAEDGLDEERRRDQLPVEKVSQGIEMPDIIAFKLETSAMPLAERLEDILDILECIAENQVPRGLQILRILALLEALVIVDPRIKANVNQTQFQ